MDTLLVPDSLPTTYDGGPQVHEKLTSYKGVGLTTPGVSANLNLTKSPAAKPVALTVGVQDTMLLVLKAQVIRVAPVAGLVKACAIGTLSRTKVIVAFVFVSMRRFAGVHANGTGNPFN